jgi:hypothetical protein
MKEIPPGFNRESFCGFDMRDEEVGPGEHRSLAIEVKHLFEGIANDADESNEEVFFVPELEHALRRFLVDPSQASLGHLSEVSPTLVSTIEHLQELIAISGD